MPSLLPTLKCTSRQFFMLSLSCCWLWCDVINCGLPGRPLLGRKHSFSGFSGLDEHWLGIGYLWHAEGAWAPNDHDVVPLSSACTGEMVGSHYFPFSLYFPQLFFIAVTYFPTGFHFLMCHGIYLEFTMTTFAQAQPLSSHEQQIDSDIKVIYLQKIIKHAAVCLVYSWWQPWLARWHRWGSCMGNHLSAWQSTLFHPLHPSPLSLSLNPHWEGEGETREAGEDEEEEGSDRTGQRLHWHPWESADPFSGNY